MQRHLRRCQACTEQINTETTLAAHLAGAGADTAEDLAAIARIERQWLASVPQTAAAPIRAPRRTGRRLMTASAVVGFSVLLFAVSVVTGPNRAIAQVQDAMSKVQNFHLRMEIPGYDVRYEAWGERGKATRVEERESGRVTMVVLDDGKTLRRYFPEEKLVRESVTRLNTVFRDAAGFQASRMLSKAARGRLFDGHEWVGEAEARETAQVRQDGVVQRRINVDLKDGYFARMVVFADVSTDRLAQAELFLDRDDTAGEPFARVYFDYPAKLDPKLFELKLPGKLPVKRTEEDLQLP
jgi:hypothetical protein